MRITCITRDIRDITTLQILDPNGVPIKLNIVLEIFTVPNVTRAYAGTYTCVVMSTIDNSTVNDTSNVIIQCKLSVWGTLTG